MDALFLTIDVALIVVLCYWAKVNDVAGSTGSTRGFFAYRDDRRPAQRTAPKAWTAKPVR